MAKPPHGPVCIGLDNGCPDCLALDAAELAEQSRRPTPADCERWRQAAAEIPGPIGHCIRILVAEVQRLGAENERQLMLLRRVACYAVVDPLGNPAAITLPHAARMLAIENDIDDCLKGRPQGAWETRGREP